MLSDLAVLVAAIGTAFASICGGVAAVIVAVRGSKKDSQHAAGRVLDAALSTQDETQNERLAEIEKKLRGGEGQ